MLNIVKYPNKILRIKAQRLSTEEVLSPVTQKLIGEMKETMVKNDGVGLAATQVGISQRIIVINFKEGPKAFINPFVYWKSFFRTELGEEGCLSFPGIFGLVKRHLSVKLFYLDETAKLQKLSAEGLMARVLLHEIDHLNGKLFIDRMIKYTKGEDKISQLIAQAKDNER